MSPDTGLEWLIELRGRCSVMKVPCLRGNKPATIVFLKVNPMFIKPTKVALACAGIFATISTAQAQIDSELNPVVISATRSAQNMSEVLSSVSVITKADIEKTQSQDIVNILNTQPGLEINRTGAVGSATSIYLRGGNSNQTLMLLDGVPFSGEAASGAISSIEMIPVSQIERIEILRGNASAIYGSGAVGGVINIVTKQGGGKPRPEASISYGSNNSRNAYLGYAGEVGNTKFSISGNTQLTDGFNSINPKSFQDVNQSPNGFRSQSYRLSVIQKLGAGLTFGISSLANDSWTSLDGTSSPIDADYSNRQLKANSAYVKYAVNDRWLSQLIYSESDNKGQTYYNQYTPYDTNWNYVGTLRPSFSNSDSKDSHKKISWLNNYDINSNNKLLFGYDQQRLLGQSRVSWAGSVNTVRDISSMYAGHTGSYGALTTQVNLRYDDIQDGESKTTWLAGLGYALDRNWKITSTYSTAFNAPTGGQLADISQGGNVNLKPEKSKSFESGLQYQNINNLAKLVYFKVDYQDLITPGNVRVSPCPFSDCGRYLVNTSNASNDGLELSWRSSLPLGTLRLSYTRQNPQNDITGAMLLNRAKEFGAVEYSYPIGALEVGGKLVASGYRYTPDAYSGATTKTGSYSTYSAYMAYRYDKEWTVRFSAENLTDKEYYQIHGYNAAPQMFFLGLRYQPK